MIFLEASPDVPYFFWQLEIQLYNFKRLGIDPANIHQVFLSQYPMSEQFKQYKAAHSDVNIHWYSDTRKNKLYIPSQRPNAFKQLFKDFPELEKETIFYHDSDIIFRCLPDFDKMNDPDTWYLSDTNSYLNADYIKSKGNGLLEAMCDIVGIKKEDVEAINKDSGGAQYLINGVNAAFWEKLEMDCEALYKYTVDSVPYWAEKFNKETGRPVSQYHCVQQWTADMWGVIWGGLLLGKKMKVVDDLAFSWGTDSIESYLAKNIYHNAGVTGGDVGRLFYKGDYINKSPFGVDFNYVDPKSASSMYVWEMQECVKYLI